MESACYAYQMFTAISLGRTLSIHNDCRFYNLHYILFFHEIQSGCYQSMRGANYSSPLDKFLISFLLTLKTWRPIPHVMPYYKQTCLGEEIYDPKHLRIEAINNHQRFLTLFQSNVVFNHR